MNVLILKNTYATFGDPAMAEKAGGALLDYGVRPEHISIVFPEGYGSPRDEATGGDQLEHAAKSGISTTTLGDAASGSAKGVGIGMVAGALAALVAVFVPGIGLVVGGGALAIALAGVAGTAVAGAIAGGATGFLKDQGIPSEAVEAYSLVLGAGGAIITVSPIGEGIDAETIQAVLQKYGGLVTMYPLVDSTMAILGDEADPGILPI